LRNEPNLVESDTPQLSWTEQKATADAIEQFAVGLRRIFIGSLLMSIAVAVFYIPLLAPFWGVAFFLPIADPRVDYLVIFCSLVGIWIYFSGKRYCLSFTLPVQNRYLLSGSVACDIGAFICRMLRDVPAIGPPTRIAGAMLALGGFLMLLGFFAYLAKLIGARVSYTLSVATGAMALGAIASAFVASMASQLLPPGWGWLPLCIMILLLLLTLVAYLFLTATLSHQLRHFSRFLKQSLAAEIGCSVEFIDSV
jgi:hypothetical protein